MKSRKPYLYLIVILVFAVNSVNFWPAGMEGARAQSAGGSEKPDLVESNHALSFNGRSDYVSLGDRSELALSTFTIEAMFMRQGTGITVTTGIDGVKAEPLIGKGVKDHSDNRDMNYFMGIQVPGNVLVADFKEKKWTDASGNQILGNLPGQSHPLIGKTPILNNVWYHAAAVYDGLTWRLYLNGNLEAEACVGQPVSNATGQFTAIGSTLNTLSQLSGFFKGTIDEVRIWNYARTPLEMISNVNKEISSYQPGLVGRWGFNESSGTVAGYTGNLPTPINGTIFGARWTTGSPFNLITPPSSLVLSSPQPGKIVHESANLSVSATDPGGRLLNYNFYIRRAPVVPDPDFTLIHIPDSQNYTTSDKLYQYFPPQTRWMVQCRSALNIAAVTHSGDVVDTSDDIQWAKADAAMSILESPGPNVIPYGISVGNHDDDVNGDPTKTVNYNLHFGFSRFNGRSYYGGRYGTANNDYNYILFSASGFKFIIIHLAYTTTPDPDMLAWANSLLQANKDRRGIVVFHNLFGTTGNPAPFSPAGETVAHTLGSNPNLFLMLGGNVHGECYRKDDYSYMGGKIVYSLCADFQDDINWGNGYLRILRFSSSQGLIHVRTFSPKNGQSKTDSNNQFDLPYSLAADKFTLLTSKSGMNSGSQVSATWTGLQPHTKYQWYVTVSNGVYTTTSQVWTFTTDQVSYWLPGVTR
ncbi:MAG: LamG-like jellyroll fold domain-containing protein [Omnitrophica WOR_2 bacterium]